MAEIDEYRENIIQNLKHLQEFINRSALFTTDNKKWKTQIDSQVKQIKNQIRELQEQVNELPSVEASHYVGSIKSFKKTVERLQNECRKRERGDSVFGPPKTNIIQTPEQKRQNAVQQLFRKGDQAQATTKGAIVQMIKITERGAELANQINIQLTAQIQQLDRMRDKVLDTASTLKKAQKNITYFAKALECDKCMVGLLILILLALIAVIVMAVKKAGN